MVRKPLFRWLSFWLFVPVGFSVQALSAGWETSTLCVRLRKPPVVDGLLSDQEWAGTTPSGPMRLPTVGERAPAQVEIRFGFDRHGLYAAGRVEATGASLDVPLCVAHDPPDMWSADCVEIFLDPGDTGFRFYQLVVNVRGALWDSFCGDPLAWEPNAVWQVGRYADGWTFEIAIPLAALDTPRPRFNDVWGMNVTRQQPQEAGPLLSNWAETYGNFARPRTFGRLIFAKRADQPLSPHREADWMEEEHALDTQLVTPHQCWTDRLTGGTPRALCLYHYGGDEITGLSPFDRIRELIELRQRFNLVLECVYLADTDAYGGYQGRLRLQRLLAERWDAFVIFGPSRARLPGDVARHIRQAVEQGAGLLCADAHPRLDLAECVPLPAPPTVLRALPKPQTPGMVPPGEPREWMSFYRCGQGRCVTLDYPDAHGWLTPSAVFSPERLWAYEYWVHFVGTALLWVLGTELPLVASDASRAVERSALPSSLTVTLHNESPQRLAADVTCFLRFPDGGRSRWARNTLDVAAKAEVALPISIPVLAPGQYALEMTGKGRFKEKGKPVTVLAAVCYLHVRGSSAIRYLRVDTDVVEADQALTGSVTVDWAQSNADRLLVDLLTVDGRVLDRQMHARTQETTIIPFTFAIPTTYTIAMRICASLEDEHGIAESQTIECTVPKRRQEGFPFVMWDCPHSVVGFSAVQQLQRAGFFVFLSGGPPHAMYRAADLSQVPYTTHIAGERDMDWHDPSSIARYVSSIVPRYAASAKHGVLAYSLGDENAIIGACTTPAGLAAYREFLRRTYRDDLAALNRAWNARYVTFDEVQPLPDNDFGTDSEAFRSGNYARWMDREVFARQGYPLLCAAFAQAFHDLDPLARTGFEGAGAFGDDVDAIVDSVMFWNVYPDVHYPLPHPNLIDEVLNGVAPRGFLRGNWMGYTPTAEQLMYASWRSLCDGANALWWWRWDGLGLYRGYLRPTLDFWPATKMLTEELRPVREGLGDLVVAATRNTLGVDILYSVPSALAARMPPFGDPLLPENAHWAFVHVLKDSGIGHRYITPRRIAAPGFTFQPVLVLPFARAMDSTTATSIQQFVQAGGTVIADLAPAELDAHATRSARGLLEEVFGVALLEATPAHRVSGVFHTEEAQVVLHDAVTDARVRQVTARVATWHGDVPLFLSHPYGRGRAYLLNCDIDTYNRYRRHADSDGLRDLLIAYCAWAGVVPRVRVLDLSRNALRATEVTLWDHHGAQLLALRPDVAAWNMGPWYADFRHSDNARVVLPQARYIYDLRARRSLGYRREFDVHLSAVRASFFGLYTTPIPKPSVEWTRTVRAGTDFVATIRMVELAGKTALWATFLGPDGKARGWAEEVRIAGNEPTPLRVRIPVNEMPGQWRLVLRDALTGNEYRCRFRVVPFAPGPDASARSRSRGSSSIAVEH